MKRISLLALLWLAAAELARAAPWPGTCLQPIAVGQTISGTFTTSDCSIYYANRTAELYYTDVYTLSGKRGQQIAITTTSSAVDSWLELHDINDVNDDHPLKVDDDSGGGRSARIPANSGYLTLPSTGTFYIWASTAKFLEMGAYTL